MRFRALPILALLLAPPAATAQVGHPPDRSPYRTIRYGQYVGASASYFNGVGGRIGVAPHKGAMAGLRYRRSSLPAPSRSSPTSSSVGRRLSRDSVWRSSSGPTRPSSRQGRISVICSTTSDAPSRIPIGSSM